MLIFARSRPSLPRRQKSSARGAAVPRSSASTPRDARPRASASRRCSTRARRRSSSGCGPPIRCMRNGAAPGGGRRHGRSASVAGRRVMVVANDATVKAGACFPMTIKKILRAQSIAAQNRLPLVYLVDSSGVFLPMQDEVFPDEDDFGRIFRNNAVLSAQGIPQYAAIMGNCVAGGAYLPVLCDTVLMTEGSGLYLAGPALVKAAIGQEISHDELGGARVHSAISGTIDYHEKDDDTCLARLRRLIGLLPPDPVAAGRPRPRSSRRAGPPTISTTWCDPTLRPSMTCASCCAAILDGGRARGVPGRVRPDARLRVRASRRKRAGDRREPASAVPPRGGRPDSVRRRHLCRQCRQGRTVRARVQSDAGADPVHPGRERL